MGWFGVIEQLYILVGVWVNWWDGVIGDGMMNFVFYRFFGEVMFYVGFIYDIILIYIVYGSVVSIYKLMLFQDVNW